MKRNYFTVLILLLLGHSLCAQVLRPMTARYSNASVKGNIVYVSNNIITTTGGLTTEAPPAGTAVNNDKLGENIDIDGNGRVTLVSYNSIWKYHSNGSLPSATWKNLGFADGAWATGGGELGYGDGDEVTCIPSGGTGSACTPGGTKYITAYFRKTITIANPSLYPGYQFTVKRDDGFVLYLNGTEIGRDNLPTGAIANNTLALVNGDDEFVTFLVASSAFATGTNDIAVEVHQSSNTSSDLSFDLKLESAAAVPLVSFGSPWRYTAPTAAPANDGSGRTWKQLNFTDGGWTLANGELGYGDGDEATCIPSGGGGTTCLPTGTKRITAYFRKSITIANPSIYRSLQFKVKRDDGFVLYVNGTEVTRNNMPGGTVLHGTVASNDVDDEIIIITVPTTTFATGQNDIAVEMHQRAATSDDLSFDLSLTGFIDSYIPFGDTWKYLDNNTRPANWHTTGYNDASWAAGPGYLGYGDPHIVTTVSYGGDANNKYTTTYFRKTFSIPNLSAYPYYIIRLKRDDGAVVYLNGTEIIRNNMPSGTIAHATFSSATADGAGETNEVNYYFPASAFLTGSNTIAVEVHQVNLTSSDLTFDLSLDGSSDSTFNSSSANLDLPNCSQVLFAGLYWGATQGSDGGNTGWITGETGLKLKLPGATNFVNVTSTQTDYHNETLVPGLPHTGYRCFANITSLVNAANADGTYTIANICSPAGIVNTSGGWTIVIAYSDPATIVRNLTVFDGSIIMNGGDPELTVPISGFLTPPSGPVSCELGAVVFDGDRVSTDEFSFKQNSNPLVGSYTNMTPNATANLNDMWNGTISYKGSVVTTRSPAHNNTLGYDADIIDVPNVSNAVLGNSQSSASIRFSSPSENYMLQVATTAISQYTPSFSVSKNATDLTGGSLIPGDSIRYQILYQNAGNDASTATTIIDNIPTGTSYAPNSLVIGGVAKTDAIGDDEAEYDFTNNRVVFRIGTGANGTTGGEVSPLSSGNVTFKVYTPSSCAVFACNSTISNRARMSYGGKLSLLSLYDSTGVIVAGCNDPSPQVNLVTGVCRPLQDTILTNTCPSLTVAVPIARYAGYVFHSGMPFTPANLYDARVPVSATRVLYAYYDGPGSCDDTIRVSVFITGCPDIDDDNDGLPDYLEFNTAAALADQDGDGRPNWADATPGAPIVWVDNNIDGSNDWYDPGADADNDGIPNFYDVNFPGFVDSNGDLMNDNMDKDKDGIPNHLDLDSDNDGIPDTVESFGVDANGDGKIDNYTDTDNDGLSQNVDASGVGGAYIYGSGLGLTGLDTDGDGTPNYLDLDSDNDGIPDIIESQGTGTGNTGKISLTIDIDGDGLLDVLDGDIGNDNVAENSASALLRTGTDGNSDGRTDTWPYKNMDGDNRPNAYDLDSDGDGISDVREASFTDSDWNGRIDGSVNTDGWNTTVAGLGSLVIPNTDGVGRENPFDIDSDDDGIPDNVEGLTTLGYLLPAYTDTDNDGIDNSYDNFSGFGGDGIHPVDTDADTVPDYLDLDTVGSPGTELEFAL